MSAHMSTPRLLDLVASEFAHLALRRQRPQFPFHRQRLQCRGFGSRAPLKQVQGIAAVQRDGGDAHVTPPVPSGGAEDAPPAHRQPNMTVKERISSREKGAQVSVEDYMASLYGRTVETGLASVGKEKEKVVKAPTAARVETRRRRKERRKEAGTFKPGVNETGVVVEEEDEVVGVETALGRIEAMEGPGVQRVEGIAELLGEEPEEALRGQGRMERMGKLRSETSDESKMSRSSRVEEAKGTPKTTPGKTTSPPTPREPWQIQKAALQAKFGSAGWQPRKRLSPDALEGIRALHTSDPLAYSTEVLAQHFKITPEAIRRVLKSKWKPSEAEVEERRVRWERRGLRKWTEMAEAGMRPPAQWRARGVMSPEARGRERRRGQGGEARERGDGERKGRREDGAVMWDGIHEMV